MILLKLSVSFQTLGFFYSQSNDDVALLIAFCVSIPIVIGAIVFWVRYLKKQAAEELRREREETANMSHEEKQQHYENKVKKTQEARNTAMFGYTSPAMICPHCQTRGQVRTRKVTQKKGISGGKATGAVLTGGISLLATGLSRKELATQAHCDVCNSTWFF